MVICLEQDAYLHMAQLMPLPLTVSCFSKIQIGFTFVVLADLDSPVKGPLNGCVCVASVALLTIAWNCNLLMLKFFAAVLQLSKDCLEIITL